MVNGEWSHQRTQFKAIEWSVHSLRLLRSRGVGSNHLFLQIKVVTEHKGGTHDTATLRRNEKYSNQNKNYQVTLPGSTPSPF